MSATKVPTDDKPLIRDPDLAKALDEILKPYDGKDLQKAQAAIRKVRQSGVQGPFSVIVETYRTAIEKAVAKD